MLPATLATLALVALGAGLFAGHQFLRTSPRFAIGAIEVTGAAHMSRAEVLAMANIELGTNIFSLDTDAVESQLKRLPWLADAVVHRHLPRTVEIALTERVAVAAISADGMYLMDERGELFKRAETKHDELLGMLIISGLTREAFAAHGEQTRALARRAYAMAAAWNRDATAESAIGEVRIAHDEALTFYTRRTGMALHVGALTEAELPTARAKFTASYGSLTAAERPLVRAIYLDNQARKSYVTVAFAN